MWVDSTRSQRLEAAIGTIYAYMAGDNSIPVVATSMGQRKQWPKSSHRATPLRAPAVGTLRSDKIKIADHDKSKTVITSVEIRAPLLTNREADAPREV